MSCFAVQQMPPAARAITTSPSVVRRHSFTSVGAAAGVHVSWRYRAVTLHRPAYRHLSRDFLKSHDLILSYLRLVGRSGLYRSLDRPCRSGGPEKKSKPHSGRPRPPKELVSYNMMASFASEPALATVLCAVPLADPSLIDHPPMPSHLPGNVAGDL